MLVTTLTKKMAESLTAYLRELDIRVEYLHSDVETLERIEADSRSARRANSTCWWASICCAKVWICRRSRWWRFWTRTRRAFCARKRRSIQTIGRAARNVDGRVIMYADQITDSMMRAIQETNRRRALQQAYNEEHRHHAEDRSQRDARADGDVTRAVDESAGKNLSSEEKQMAIEALEERMLEAAEQPRFRKGGEAARPDACAEAAKR